MPHVSGTPLADAYPGHYGRIRPDNKQQEYRTNAYFNVCQMATTVKQGLQCISQATGAIVHNNSVQGNALLIAPTLVLVPAHCFPNQTGTIIFPGKPNERVHAKTLIDGTSVPEKVFQGDFKILEIPRMERGPAPLSTAPSTGKTLTMYYKQNGDQYIKPYRSEGSRYAGRSDRSQESSMAGECGGPRVGLSSQAVHSIHQGESEGLKINDILLSLERLASLQPDLAPVIDSIFDNIHVIDMSARYLYTSPLSLRPGDVRPEGAQHKIPIKRVGQFDTPTVTISNNHVEDTHIALEDIQFADLWKRSQTIASYKTARIDIQNPSATHKNLQVQLNSKHSNGAKTAIATVLIDKRLERVCHKNQQTYVRNRVRDALRFSLTRALQGDYVIYSLDLPEAWVLD